MSTRTQDAIERAGKIDRVHRTLEHAKQEIEKAQREAFEVESTGDLNTDIAFTLHNLNSALRITARL